MSILSTIENAIVAHLAAATYNGGPLFATVEGASGPFRAAIRKAIERERLPAAYVIFVDEKTAPETKPEERGPRFSILVADRALRLTSDPRRGDAGVLGAFTLIEQTRIRLDNFAPVSDTAMTPLLQRFADADERLAVYELLYRVRPIEDPPTFDGEFLGGSSSFFAVDVGPPRIEAVSFEFPGIDGSFRHLLAERGRAITCRGRLRAATPAALNALEAGLDAYVRAGTAHTLVDGAARPYANCVLRRWSRDGPRFTEAETAMVVQAVEIEFEQLSP